MIDPTAAARLAARLSRGQRSVVLSLDDRALSVLGCGEAVAQRLSKSTGARPALVEVKPFGIRTGFRLTPAGAAVRTILKAGA